MPARLPHHRRRSRAGDGPAPRAPGGVGAALPRAERRRRGMTRTRRRVAIAAVIVAFLAVSLIVARWLQADNAERAKVERLLAAQSRGDVAAMTAEIGDCPAACEAQLTRLAARLRGDGKVEIVRYDSG